MTTLLLNNRYQILESLGRGGFGETFLAIDTHMPSARKCVIKKLKPLIQQPQIPAWLQERFQQEAAILEELGENHPQIPRLYAYFAEDSDFYLVQEWIEGMTLTQKQKQQGNFSEQDVRGIIVNLLPILDYVHSRRIIHRDVKPDNIILRASDGKPVLIDFGVIKQAMTTLIDPQGNAVSSVVLGTPGYMASEQAAGRPVYSSDLYSLGLVTVFLLTGKSPQNLETDPHTGEMRWRQEVPNLHSDLATVIDKAIRFHPRDRFASAQEMLQALSASSSSTTTTATTATVAVAPGARLSKTKSVKTKTKTVSQSDRASTPRALTPPSPEIEPRKGNPIPGILGVLLLFGLMAGAFAFGFKSFSFKERSRPTPSPSKTIDSSPQTFPSLQTPEPQIRRTPIPDVTISPTPEATESPTPSPEATETPTPEATESPTPSPEATETPTPEATESPTPSPEATESPTPEATESPTSEATETPTPEASSTPIEVIPPPISPNPPRLEIRRERLDKDERERFKPKKKEEENNESDKDKSSLKLPTFSPGTQENRIREMLGQPTSVSKGVWGNSRAVLYKDVIRDRADLGYLFDVETGKLRQTEVSLTQSVGMGTVQKTAKGLFGGKTPPSVEQALEQIYHRRLNQYRFVVGNLEGVIERNSSDRIYIGIWEADFH